MKIVVLLSALCCLMAAPVLAQTPGATSFLEPTLIDTGATAADMAAFIQSLVASTATAFPVAIRNYEPPKLLSDDFPLRWDLDSLLSAAVEAGMDVPKTMAEGLEDLLRKAIVMGTPLRLESLMKLPDLQGYEPTVYPKILEFLQLVVAKTRASIRLGSHPPDTVWSLLGYVTTRAAELARHLPPYSSFEDSGSIEEVLKFDSDKIVKEALDLLPATGNIPGDLVDLQSLIKVDIEGLGPKSWDLYTPPAVDLLPLPVLDDLIKLISGMFYSGKTLGKDDLRKVLPAVGLDVMIEPIQTFLNDFVTPMYNQALGVWTAIAGQFKGYADAFRDFTSHMAAKYVERFLKMGKEWVDTVPRSELLSYFEKLATKLFAGVTARIPACDRFLDKFFEKSLCDLFFSQTFGPKARRRLMYDPSKPPGKNRAAGEVYITNLGIEPEPTLIGAAIQPISIGYDLLDPLADIFMSDQTGKIVEYTDLELDTFLKEVLAPFVHMMQQRAATFHKILAAGGYSCEKGDCGAEKHVFESMMSVNVVEGFRLLQPAAGYSKKVTTDVYDFMTRLATELFYEARTYAEMFPKVPFLPPPPVKVPPLQPLDALMDLDGIASYLLGELTKPTGGGAADALADFFKSPLSKTMEILDMFVKELVNAFQPVSKLFKGGFYEIASINFISHEGGKMLREFRRYFDNSGPVDEASRAKYLRQVAAAIIKDAQLRIPAIERLADRFDKGLFTLFQEALKGGHEITPSVMTGLPQPGTLLLKPDEWMTFLQRILAPFLERLRLGGDRHHKEGGSVENQQVFDDYLASLAVDGYHVLLGELTESFTVTLSAAVTMPPPAHRD
ncbi:unnamed protein product [Vitrella brassicaformis CCMP3155]|uniref:Uncharacterized protein n=1 Tax=Vitrella brassicaformis (strain CCMP3155) TaxID=1169540 RepID=A0A0G4EQZ0_VITBC|nr:unnamed protein product [Vitrella brassicaformis CCMP3155]|eukprot:CEL99986.1 unnamed protein product [Vitrella brassicaformis CCMP3155]